MYSDVRVVGGIQPKILTGIFNTESHSEGLTPRFLMCMHEEERVSFSREGVDDDDLMIWNDFIGYCHQIPLTVNEEGKPKPKRLILSSDALDSYEAFFNEYHALKPFLSEPAQGFIPKYLGYCLRFAGILHIMDCFFKSYPKLPRVTSREALKIVALQSYPRVTQSGDFEVIQ